MTSSSSSVLLVAALFAVCVGSAHGIAKVPPGPNITATYGDKWLEAKSTWYGKPTGAAPKDNGGACGYKDVDKAPYDGMTGCGNTPIFKDGRGCGSCFELKCDKPESCSDEPKGEEQKLRSAGELEVKFRRVKCKYPKDTKVTFHVEKGSNPNYLGLLVKYVDGDGYVVGVDIKKKGEDKWIELKESWGEVWRIDTPKKLTGPFTVRYTTEGGTKKEIEDVIPEG
uniref:Uncharacterized protein n=1 Tax=Avena sativa TaxID=4498 RepID=A0ACD5TSR8_AVESA